MVAGGHAWLPEGACMVEGGMHGCQGHAWLLGGMCGCWGACVIVRGGHVWLPGGIHGCWGGAWLLGGMHGCGGGHAWLQRGVRRIRRDTVNERAVRLLLECILV